MAALDLNCFEKVGLFFSARGLPKLDALSQTGVCSLLLVGMRVTK